MSSSQDDQTRSEMSTTGRSRRTSTARKVFDPSPVIHATAKQPPPKKVTPQKKSKKNGQHPSASTSVAPVAPPPVPEPSPASVSVREWASTPASSSASAKPKSKSPKKEKPTVFNFGRLKLSSSVQRTRVSPVRVENGQQFLNGKKSLENGPTTVAEPLPTTSTPTVEETSLDASQITDTSIQETFSSSEATPELKPHIEEPKPPPVVDTGQTGVEIHPPDTQPSTSAQTPVVTYKTKKTTLVPGQTVLVGKSHRPFEVPVSLLAERVSRKRKVAPRLYPGEDEVEISPPTRPAQPKKTSAAVKRKVSAIKTPTTTPASSPAPTPFLPRFTLGPNTNAVKREILQPLRIRIKPIIDPSQPSPSFATPSPMTSMSLDIPTPSPFPNQSAEPSPAFSANAGEEAVRKQSLQLPYGKNKKFFPGQTVLVGKSLKRVVIPTANISERPARVSKTVTFTYPGEDIEPKPAPKRRKSVPQSAPAFSTFPDLALWSEVQQLISKTKCGAGQTPLASPALSQYSFRAYKPRSRFDEDIEGTYADDDVPEDFDNDEIKYLKDRYPCIRDSFALQPRNGDEEVPFVKHIFSSDHMRYLDESVTPPSPSSPVSSDDEEIDIENDDEEEKAPSKEFNYFYSKDFWFAVEKARLVAKHIMYDGRKTAVELRSIVQRLIGQYPAAYQVVRILDHVVDFLMEVQGAKDPVSAQLATFLYSNRLAKTLQSFLSVATLEANEQLLENLNVKNLACYFQLLRYAAAGWRGIKSAFIFDFRQKLDAEVCKILSDVFNEGYTDRFSAMLQRPSRLLSITDGHVLYVAMDNARNWPALDIMDAISRLNVDTSTCLLRIKDVVGELRKKLRKAIETVDPGKNLVIVAYGPACLVVSDVAKDVSNVSGAIFFKYPLYTDYGSTITKRNAVRKLAFPVLFVAGEAEWEQFGLDIEALGPSYALCLVGRADADLQVDISLLRQLRITQVVVNRLILEHAIDFIDEFVDEDTYRLAPVRNFNFLSKIDAATCLKDDATVWTNIARKFEPAYKTQAKYRKRKQQSSLWSPHYLFAKDPTRRKKKSVHPPRKQKAVEHAASVQQVGDKVQQQSQQQSQQIVVASTLPQPMQMQSMTVATLPSRAITVQRQQAPTGGTTFYLNNTASVRQPVTQRFPTYVIRAVGRPTQQIIRLPVRRQMPNQIMCTSRPQTIILRSMRPTTTIVACNASTMPRPSPNQQQPGSTAVFVSSSTSRPSAGPLTTASGIQIVPGSSAVAFSSAAASSSSLQQQQPPQQQQQPVPTTTASSEDIEAAELLSGLIGDDLDF